MNGNGWSEYRAEKSVFFFKGVLQYSKLVVRTAEDLMNLVGSVFGSSLFTPREFDEKLLKFANGNFALILKIGDEIFVATDLIRSCPVYTTCQGNHLLITDTVNGNSSALAPDLSAVGTFIAAHYTFGTQTVFRNCESVGPGEILHIRPGHNPARHSYFRFIYDPSVVNLKSDGELSRELDRLLESLFSRMIAQQPEDTLWIVPLSGGIDSRIIANYLSRLKAPNVLCFSYGIPGNPQSELSRRVANTLNLDWTFIEYTEKKWGELHRKGQIDRFLRYSFNGDSLPHLQDFLAVYELKKRGLTTPNSFVVPGHNLGFVADYVSNDEITSNKEADVISKIIDKFIQSSATSAIRKQITEQFRTLEVGAASYVEYFAWANRHTKFTGNSVRVYEFFDLGWRMPYWEKDLLEFWLKIDVERRRDQNLYLSAAKDILSSSTLGTIPYAKKAGGIVKSRSRKISSTVSSLTKKFPPLRFFHKRFARTKHSDEGLTQIYAGKGPLVEDMTGNIGHWPAALRPQLKPFLPRNTTRINYHKLTAIYTIWREVLGKQDDH